jgi:hypothetical protein
VNLLDVDHFHLHAEFQHHGHCALLIAANAIDKISSHFIAPIYLTPPSPTFIHPPSLISPEMDAFPSSSLSVPHINNGEIDLLAFLDDQRRALLTDLRCVGRLCTNRRTVYVHVFLVRAVGTEVGRTYVYAKKELIYVYVRVPR